MGTLIGDYNSLCFPVEFKLSYKPGPDTEIRLGLGTGKAFKGSGLEHFAHSTTEVNCDYSLITIYKEGDSLYTFQVHL